VQNLLQQMVSNVKCILCFNPSNSNIAIVAHWHFLTAKQVPVNNEVPCFFNYFALDEMGSRITELEQSINDLRTEMGAEGSPSPLAPSKKPDDATPEEGSA
ncbi:hypothetical protein RJ640_019889, partial [Escallonia rubra]